MKIIRKNSFETNSSSTHSLTLENGLVDWDNKWSLTYEEEYVISRKEYGWQFERYNKMDDKVPYIAMLVHLDPIKRQWVNEILMEETGARRVVWSMLRNDTNGFIDSYIDHHGEGKGIAAVLENKESIRNFIFNRFCWLILGNDNNEAHPNWNEAPFVFRTKEYIISPNDDDSFLSMNKNSYFIDGPLKGKAFLEKLDNYIGYLLQNKSETELYKRHHAKYPKMGSYSISYSYDLGNPKKRWDRYSKTFYKQKGGKLGRREGKILSVPITWIYYENYETKTPIELEKETMEFIIIDNFCKDRTPQQNNY